MRVPTQPTVPPVPKFITVGDEFIYSANDETYKIVVIGIFKQIFCEVWDSDGSCFGEYIIVNEDFFNQDCVERK